MQYFRLRLQELPSQRKTLRKFKSAHIRESVRNNDRVRLSGQVTRLPPVLDRLGDVGAADPWLPCQIGDRARHFEHPGRAARREPELELVRELDTGAESALIVGHNPGVSELAQALVPGFEQNLPTGAVVEIDLALDTWAGLRRGGGSLRSYDYPKNIE